MNGRRRGEEGEEEEEEEEVERGRGSMMWGTWEELLLAGAVERHGTRNWELISEELRARIVSPYVFSPEACKGKYDALRRRFNGHVSENPERSNDERNSLLLEALRARRIAQLKTQEIPLKNDSIGSLESELRRLKAGEDSKAGSERSKDRSSAGSFTEAAAPDGAETAAWGSPGKHQRIETVCEIDKSEGIQSDRIGRRDQESNPLHVVERGSPKRDPDRDDEKKAAEAEAEAESVPVPGPGSVPGPVPVPVPVPSSRTETGPKNQHHISEVHPSSPLDSFYGSSETLADEKENRRSRNDFVESKDSNIKGRRLRTDLALKKTDLRSCRRPSGNGSHRVLMPHKPKTEDFDAETAQRSNPQQNPDENDNYPAPTNSPVKSEADRNGEGDRDQASIGCTENSELHTVDTNASEKSPAPIPRGKRKQGKKNPAAFGATTRIDSETWRQKQNEVGIEEGSAESMDMDGKELKGTRDECQKGLPVDSDVLSSANPAEISTRQGTKAFSSSRDASESGQGQGQRQRQRSRHGQGQGHYKECDEFMDAWHHTTRSSGDSHMEDRMEGTDEIETSPMSRRSRREPKVPGKLLPLLECLRSITSHKFGSLFKHKLESQNKQQYRNIIRRHMDLGMIRARLEEGSYSGSQEFFRDLLLVFNNALMFYPKSSQEHRAAVVLRELANNEMTKIFQTEALLKQEGPSTRKRDPRAIPGPSASATKFNPSSRKRNARPLLGGGVRAAPRSKTTSKLNNKEEQYNSQEPPPKEGIEVSSSAGLKPENEPEAENFEAEPPNTSKMPKAGDERKTSGSSIQHKKVSGFHNDPKKNSNTEPKKTTIGNTHKSHSHNNGRGGTEQLLGKVAAMKEEKGNPPPEPTHKQRTPDQDQPSPLKRGRPPKHVKRASGADDQPPSKATGDPEASRARKRLRK